jgi:hypothetical protein
VKIPFLLHCDTMSSEDVNMLIEMGFPRNKAYVYSLTI